MKHVDRSAKATLARMSLGAILSAACGLAATAHAASPASLAQAPLFLVTAAEPLVMLNMSNDHQLFYKAYDDWSDVDGDGEVDTSYKHSIDYYGYFDSYKCYEYDNGRFEPQSVTADKYCSGQWSGNFLNWASMTRIDTVRKILFGGARSTDTSSSTVLERAYLPGDAHSFAKYYAASTTEMAKLTPFPVTEITLCNTTYAASGVSENVTAPPLIRVAAGNFALWAANERYQCHWDDKSESQRDIFNSPNPYTHNGNHPATTGLDAAADNPSWTSDKLGEGDYKARVEACVTGLVGSENCTFYPDGNSKPTGLLQQYGDEGQIRFGLLTGSYQKNKSGGSLRRNIGDISNEINSDTDGTFKNPPPAGGNIIRSLSALRVSGYEHTEGVYNSADNCAWSRSSFPDGQCTNWGNPQSEIYLESLRYFAGKSANSAFKANDSSYINNLPTAGSWADPLSDANYCAPVNIIQFNASVTSYDGDQLGGTSDLAGLGALSTWTDEVGAGEGISGSDRFVGTGSTTTTTDGLCTAKTLDGLSDAEGICPEAPRLEGGYDIAGLAYYAHTSSIRTDIDDVSGATADIRVNTYGVSLAPSVPKIEVPVPGSDKVVTILPACRNQNVGGNCAIVDFKVVQAHSVADGVGTGKFYVNWEDSEQGGDYDQDMAGVLSYSVSGTQITVLTSVFAESASDKMAFGYVIAGTTQDGFHAHSGINGFTGYTDPTGVLSCSSGANCNVGTAASVTYEVGNSDDELLKDPLWYAAKWGGFTEEEDAADRPAGAAAPNDQPDQAYEWDGNGDGLPDNYFYSTNPAQLASSLSSVFLGISAQQASAASTAANSQRADAGTFVFQARFNSKDWSSELLKYTVNLATGQLELDTTTWGSKGDAGVLLDSLNPDSRRVITYDADADAGIAFRWDSLPAIQKAWLNLDPKTATADTKGEDRVAYLRGDRSLELQTGAGTFRNRSRVLGDIVSSSPVYVGKPPYNYPDYLEDSGYETYSAFSARVAARAKMLWVGANDGMLHGFDVDTGAEKLAYIPNAVFPNLSQLTSGDYTHSYYVDGSPSLGDVTFASDLQWHTVLVGGLNAGGQGVYALDVTDPASFSEAGAAQTLLWEISPASTGFGDLGYTFARPAIVKNGNGDWVAVFGNGYASTSGKAVLYVMNIETGALISSVEVGAGGDNGLSTVAPVDTNGDQIIDAIYAGDLKGNLWKFVPNSIAAGTWQAAFSGAPLFTAPADASGYLQPITSRPEVGVHPEGKAGVMVYFGTGKYFENGDNLASSDVQRFYGIWDLWDEGSSSSSKDVPAGLEPSISTANLLQQCVTQGDYADTCVSNAAISTGEALYDYDVRFVSDHQITNWSWETTGDNAGKMGWYIDLPERGEMQVSNAALRGGRIIFVTIVPSEHSCSEGGSSWLMELDAADGSRMPVVAFDINGDGLFDLQDTKETTTDTGETINLVPAGKKSREGIIQPPTILTGPDGRKEFKYSSGSTGTVELTVENPVPFDEGRKSWIQLK